jgi:hypothetical protein
VRCLRGLLIVFLCIDIFHPAAAQLSCSSVPAISGPTGYQRRLNADRCEGFFEQRVAGSTLEFLSLVKGAINYDLVSDKALIVSAPNLSQFGRVQIFLTARALRPGTYYRMDAVVASGESFRWPLNAVLSPANLPSNAIGVVAWVNRDLVKYYVPVSVVSENIATPAARPPLMILRSSNDIEILQWRSWQESGRERIGDWITLGGAQPAIIRAGQPISLELKGQPSGLAVIEVAVKYANQGKPQTEQFRIALP